MSGERDRRVTKERPRVGRVEGQGKDRRNDPRTDPITFISALPSPVVPSPEGTAEGGVTVIRREKSGYEGGVRAG